MPTPWEIEGDYFESCNCAVGCPCTFLGMPTDGHCDIAAAFRVERGRYGQVPLDGLGVVAVFHIPGHIAAGNFTLALYIDERADPDQRTALEAIFSGRAGGALQHFKALTTNYLEPRAVPLQFTVEGRRRAIRIPDVLECELQAIKGLVGRECVIQDPPAALAAPFPPVVARTMTHRYADHGMQWDNAGKNAFYSRFRYTG